MSGYIHPRSMVSNSFSEMVDYIEANTKNTTVHDRVEYPDNGCPTQGPPLNSDLSKCLHPLDEPSCSSQQEPIYKEMKHISDKSPIAILNEIMLSKKQVVEYKFVSVRGHVHSPVFTFIATNNEISAYGEGFSKKEAKKNAAIAFLDKLDDSNRNNTITSTTSTISPRKLSSFNKENILDELSKVNPIGMLQELCMARHWELPDYKFTHDERNKPHNTCYSVLCSLKELKSVGEGKTKQAAKRQAAHNMYDQIKNVLQQKISKPKDYVNNTIPSKCMLDAEGSKDFNCFNNLQPLEMFFNQLKSSQKQGLSRLRNTDSAIEIRSNSIDLLRAIGEEENFSITYILMTNMSNDIEMLVQLAVTPLVLFIGNGKSIPEAKEMAAYVALSYMKLFLEK